MPQECSMREGPSILWRRISHALFGLSIAFSLLHAALLRAGDAETLRVMTFNLWQGGEEGKQPLDQTVKVIHAAKADVAGLQETKGLEVNGQRPDNARRIAEKLAWHYFDQGHETGVIGRYRIVEHTPKKSGVRIELPSGRRIWFFNAHFAHAPYQPYQLLKIPYADAPFIEGAQQAVLEARKARGSQVKAMLDEVRQVRDEQSSIFIVGDFNEPSALDWTEKVFGRGRCPAAVRWPTTAAVLDAGFIDAYREIHPDPLKWLGFTWTPTTAEDDPKDRHDRIDFVFAGGRRPRIKNAQIVGERSERADLIVSPYPSDHRAVVATVAWE